MLITGKLYSVRKYHSFRDTSFASTFVHERKVREGGKRVGRESIRTRVERGKKREERMKVGSGIQWPVSSREDTNVMPGVNARERGIVGGGMGMQEERERSERATGRAEAARIVVVEQWNTDIPQHHHLSDTPLIPSSLFSLAFRFLLFLVTYPCLTDYILNVCKT